MKNNIENNQKDKKKEEKESEIIEDDKKNKKNKEKKEKKREKYINSCEQLITISSILLGFGFSGLLAVFSIDKELYTEIIVKYFNGNLNLSLYSSFYSLFISTLCFLSTILTIVVYRIRWNSLKISKITRIYLVSNLLFSIGVASLLISIVVFAIPTLYGLVIGILCGLGISIDFIIENIFLYEKNQ